MTTLVTGASGFVGSAVLRHLLERGDRVRALVRKGSDRRNIEGLDVELAIGDLRDKSSLDRAMRGCRTLFHVAADYRLWVPDAASMYQANVDGTKNIMLAALESGIERIVYTSSVATLGLNSDGSPADETTPSSLHDMVGHYKRSKFLAELEVQRLIRERGLPAVIVSPSTPIGPRDVKPTPTGRLIVDTLAGRMPAYVHTGLNLVHVDDVATGHVLAFESGRIGERYILGGQDMTLKDILSELDAVAGQATSLRIRLPHSVLVPMAFMTETWARFTRGCEPRMTLDSVRMSRKFMFFSSQKARLELGYESRPVRVALRDAVNWFRQNAYCR